MRPGVVLGLAGVGAIVLLTLVGMTAMTLRNAGLLGGAPVASTAQTFSSPTAPATALAPTSATVPSGSAQANASRATPGPPLPPTTAPIPTPAPAAPAAERFVVAGAGAEGVNLREQPGTTAPRIRTLHDGAEVEAAGEERDENRESDGRHWRHVRDLSDGQVGWIAAEFLRPESIGATSSDDATSAYQSQMTEMLRDVRSAVAGLRTQLGRLDATPALADDPTWQAAAFLPLAALQARGQELQAHQSVPPSATDLHRQVDALGSEIVALHAQFIAALERRSEADAREAAEQLNALGPKIDRIEAALHELEPAPDNAGEPAVAALPTATPTSPPVTPTTPPTPTAPATPVPGATPTAPPTAAPPALAAPPAAPATQPPSPTSPPSGPPEPAPPTAPPAAPTAQAPKPSTGRAAPRGADCPPSHPIKGNHSSRGEWIYHPPGGQFYSRTRPEECFATPADAVRAGYRASQR